MRKLTKKYKVVHIGKKILFPVKSNGDSSEIIPSPEATAVEFDTYAEAKAYVDEHRLVYEEPKFDAPVGV